MGNPVYLVELQALAWRQYMRSGAPGAGGTPVEGNTRLAINPTKTYRVTARCRLQAAADGVLYIGVVFYDATGAYDLVWGGIATGPALSTAWATYTSTFGAGTGYAIPGGAVSMAPRAHLNFGATVGYHECLELWIEDTAAPGVALSNGRSMRNPSEWGLHVITGIPAGVPPEYRTWIGGEVETLTLRYATGPYMTQASDTPPREQYDARVLQPGLLRLESPGVGGGVVMPSYGQIVLANGDGALAELAYYGLEGQAFTVKRGEDDKAYSTFTTVMQGAMQQAVVDTQRVTIRLAGRDAAFDRPACTLQYLGNNALPAGLEGGSDMAGQPKPVLYGVVRGIEPPCVNSTRLIYQVSAASVPAYADLVFVAGVALTAGADYTSQADMETNAPAAGAWRNWPAGGMFRLGTAPAGVVTCDASAVEAPGGSTSHWWIQLYRVAVDAGVESGEFQFTQGYNSFSPPDNWPGVDHVAELPVMGVWVNDARTTFRQVMAQIAGAAGAWAGFIQWGGSPGGAMKFGGQIFPPNIAGNTSNLPLLDKSNLLGAPQAVADPGEGRGTPVWRVDLGCRPNYTPHSPSMAPSIPPQQLAGTFLALRNLRVVGQDATVKDKHPEARTVVRDTCFAEADPGVGYEITRQLALLRYQKLWYAVRVSLQAVLDMPFKPRLGGYVRLEFDGLAVLWQDGVTRGWGYFNVMAIEVDFSRNHVALTLRQATEQSI